MNGYSKKHAVDSYTGRDSGWQVLQGDKKLATLDNENLADLLLACLEGGWTAQQLRARAVERPRHPLMPAEVERALELVQRLQELTEETPEDMPESGVAFFVSVQEKSRGIGETIERTHRVSENSGMPYATGRAE